MEEVGAGVAVGLTSSPSFHPSLREEVPTPLSCLSAVDSGPDWDFSGDNTKCSNN